MSYYGPILYLFVGIAEYRVRTEAIPFKTEIGIETPGVELKTETLCAKRILLAIYFSDRKILFCD